MALWRTRADKGSPHRIYGQFHRSARELRELGYEEGRNILIDYLWAEGRYERFPALVAEFIDAKVDLIVTEGPLRRLQ